MASSVYIFKMGKIWIAVFRHRPHRLQSGLWSRREISLHTKGRVYQAVGRSDLLYSFTYWPLPYPFVHPIHLCCLIPCAVYVVSSLSKSVFHNCVRNVNTCCHHWSHHGHISECRRIHQIQVGIIIMRCGEYRLISDHLFYKSSLKKYKCLGFGLTLRNCPGNWIQQECLLDT